MKVKILFALFSTAAFLNGQTSKPGDDLQAVLDSGKDLALQKGGVYNIDSVLTLKVEGQKIHTEGAVTVADYARLKISSPKISRILNMNGKAGAVLEKVIFDGNRYEDRNIEIRESLVQAGMRGGDNQTIRNCVFLNARGWSLLHVFEPAVGTIIEGNFFFGAGVDCRGGGAALHEKPFPWGDGISLAASNAQVRNNLIIDVTDVGIVIFGARGSVVEDNVVAAISREALGGVNMVDITGYYENPKGSKRIDYNGVIVRRNLVDAKGARIHIGFPMGRHIWGPGKTAGKDGHVVEGARVEENEVRGLCMGYGFAMHGVENFKVQNNISNARYSRLGDGLGYKRPDEPCAFIFDGETVKNCDLQNDFIKSKKTVVHLLACNFGERRDKGEGWRMYQYGASEAMGAVETAYEEMLGRKPTETELKSDVIRLDAERNSADELRIRIKPAHMEKDLKLQNFRTQKWLKGLDEVQKNSLKKSKRLPTAKEAYEEIWNGISAGKF